VIDVVIASSMEDFRKVTEEPNDINRMDVDGISFIRFGLMKN